MNLDELSKLKKGDIVRHEPSYADYVVLINVGGVPTVLRSIQLHAAPDWSHVCTPTPVPPAPAPYASVGQMTTELKTLGWTFNEGTNCWISPNGFFGTSILHTAWEYRNSWRETFTGVLPVFSERRRALFDAGWKVNDVKEWCSPSGERFEDSAHAWLAMHERL